MKKLIFSILFMIALDCYSQTSLQSVINTDTTIYKPVISEKIYKDIHIRDPKTGKLLAFKEHGKEWVIYDPKKAIEVLVEELQKRNVTVSNTFQLFTY